jgi:beta-lactamase class A
MVELTRRSALGGTLVLAAWATGCSSRPKSTDPAEPLAPIGDRIDALTQKHNVRVGLFAADLGSGRTLEYHADDMFAMCSTFKTYAAARVLRGCERGELALGDQVFISPAGVVANSPVTEPRAGHAMALGELCAAALQRSDNTAANLLLTTIAGLAELTPWDRSAGFLEVRPAPSRGR